MIAERLAARPMVGKLVVPFMVDESRDPIDFKQLDPARVRACADRRLCGVCGSRIEIYERLAFIGPRKLLERACFSDPWMHEDCADLAMGQCPFLNGRKDWRPDPERAQELARLIEAYSFDMAKRTAPAGRAHKDRFGQLHFEAIGALRQG